MATKGTAVTLYTELRDAGVPIDSHYGDLYFKPSPEALEILRRYPLQQSQASSFISLIDGERWIDIPFAFDPHWENRR